ncbi:MAG: Cys-tRNA(Pro) deacylase [Candidatus Kapabacteria bacterium]|nr:Cys-tRNA(Pro) deacylase [Candidatus Kapabacteria bacterium]
MGKNKIPVTPAIRVLRGKKIDFEAHIYDYNEKGGTKQTADELKVDEHAVIKTLIMDIDGGKTIVVLMHGDKEVSTKELGRIIGSKTVVPCDAAKAQKQTGYQFGGTSPFGTKKEMPVYAEESIFALEKIYINGGKRGFIVEISPQALEVVFEIGKVAAAV